MLMLLLLLLCVQFCVHSGLSGFNIIYARYSTRAPKWGALVRVTALRRALPAAAAKRRGELSNKRRV